MHIVGFDSGPSIWKNDKQVCYTSFLVTHKCTNIINIRHTHCLLTMYMYTDAYSDCVVTNGMCIAVFTWLCVIKTLIVVWIFITYEFLLMFVAL